MTDNSHVAHIFKLTAATLGVVPDNGALILVFAQKGESGGPRVKMILIFRKYSVYAQEHSEAELLEQEGKKMFSTLNPPDMSFEERNWQLIIYLDRGKDRAHCTGYRNRITNMVKIFLSPLIEMLKVFRDKRCEAVWFHLGHKEPENVRIWQRYLLLVASWGNHEVTE